MREWDLRESVLSSAALKAHIKFKYLYLNTKEHYWVEHWLKTFEKVKDKYFAGFLLK